MCADATYVNQWFTHYIHNTRILVCVYTQSRANVCATICMLRDGGVLNNDVITVFSFVPSPKRRPMIRGLYFRASDSQTFPYLHRLKGKRMYASWWALTSRRANIKTLASCRTFFNWNTVFLPVQALWIALVLTLIYRKLCSFFFFPLSCSVKTATETLHIS